ncbi:CagY family CD-EC repeat-containing protein, partial [Helicobacter pylori]|uniref:CagY family CD-EC repeat-containing protein n=1 Tax=Helicobacter pylori TaxID=210 RepID=UPI002711F89F
KKLLENQALDCLKNAKTEAEKKRCVKDLPKDLQKKVLAKESVRVYLDCVSKAKNVPRLMLPVGRVWFSLCVPIVGILQSLSSNAFPTGLTHHISKGVTLRTSYARYECMGI